MHCYFWIDLLNFYCFEDLILQKISLVVITHQYCFEQFLNSQIRPVLEKLMYIFKKSHAYSPRCDHCLYFSPAFLLWIRKSCLNWLKMIHCCLHFVYFCYWRCFHEISSLLDAQTLFLFILTFCFDRYS